MKPRTWVAIAAAGLLIACGQKQTETEKKIAEMEQQLKLAEMEKKLAEAKGEPASGAPAQPNAAAAVPSASNPAGQAQTKTPSPVEQAKTTPTAPPPPPEPVTHTIPTGTPISIQTTTKISTKTSEAGSVFDASLAQPLVIHGYTVAERGAHVEGIVANADPGGRVKGVATIAIGARSITMADGRRLSIKTTPKTFEAKKSGKKDAAKIGIGTGVGAAIGAIAGGGRGAAIGAGAGAAGGTGLVLATHGNPAEVPAESAIALTLSAPVTVQELKK